MVLIERYHLLSSIKVLFQIVYHLLEWFDLVEVIVATLLFTNIITLYSYDSLDHVISELEFPLSPYWPKNRIKVHTY